MAANNKNSSNRSSIRSGNAGGNSAKKASGSRKTTGTKTSGKKAGSGKRAANQRKKTSFDADPYQDEIIVIITLVISILFALSTFNLCGLFGRWVGSLLFGVFGVLAYFIPYLLFLGVAFSISNRGNYSVQFKIGCCVGVCIMATALLHMFSVGYEPGADILQYYTESAAGKSGGGILGAAIAGGLCSLFGQAGTYVILFGTEIGLFILITEKLLFAGVREKSIHSKERFDARREQQRAEREVYQEQRRARALEVSKAPRAKVFTFSQADKAASPFKVFGTDTRNTLSSAVSAENIAADIPDSYAAADNTTANILDSYTTADNTADNVVDSYTAVKKVPSNAADMPDKELFSDNMPELSISRYIPDTPQEIPVYQAELEQKFRHSASDLTQPDKPMQTDESIQADELIQDNEQMFIQEETEEIWPVVSEEKEEETVAEETPAEEALAVSEGQTDDLSENENGASMVFRNAEADRFFDAIEKEMQEEKEQQASQENGKASEKSDTKEELTSVDEETVKNSTVVEKPKHVFPPLDLLAAPKGDEKSMSDEELKKTAMKLQSTLESFGVRVEMKNVSCGPTVTRYELQPALGVKVSRITSLTDDIKLSLAAADIRIEAPIPGKAAVGIEVPNTHNSMVYLRTLLESTEFKEHKSNIAIAVGKDIGGKTIVADIAKMPHLLIAGATGSGKSVFINTLIMSILYKAHPDEVKLIMVDPKVVELSVYNGIPHLLIPVVTDPKKASGALNWAVMEMTERYKKFADLGVRDLKGFNEKVSVLENPQDERFQKMPHIVIIVDELADLMMVAAGEVEDAICRLAQLARACGIHLVIATQRPSVNVITGVIKANIPSRVAFAVSSAVDSRTILDGSGAEKLLGNGDMLFFPSGIPKPIRVQGSYVSDKEVSKVVDFFKEQHGTVEYNEEVTNKIATAVVSDSGQTGGNDRDEHFIEAGKFVIERDKASIGVLQRVFKVGYNRAARIMDQLYDAGVVGPEEGTKPRKVLMSMEQFEEYVDEYV